MQANENETEKRLSEVEHTERQCLRWKLKSSNAEYVVINSAVLNAVQEVNGCVCD